MQLVAPDILADACGLSVGLCVTGIVLGVALWLFGWWCHRFWIVLLTTVVAGIYGLYEAPALRAQSLIAAVLLALTAGLLALALVRLLAFLAGGMAGLTAAQALFPNFNQPLICFLACGLLSLFLFRLAIMVLSSLAGTILTSYSALCLINSYGNLDAVAWTEQGTLLLNWVCGLLAFMGFAFQFFMDRRAAKREKKERGETDPWDLLLGSRSKWSKKAA